MANRKPRNFRKIGQVYAFVAAWFALDVWAARSGFLARFDSAVIMAAGFFVPWTCYSAGVLFSRTFRQFVETRDLKTMTRIEAGRILGGIAFGLAVWQGLMPIQFTLVTFLTDEAIGLSAFWVASRLHGRNPKLFKAWHLAGFIFLMVSGSLGALCSPALHLFGGPLTSQLMTTLPFSLVPTFFGPVVTIAHCIVLTRMRKADRSWQ